MLLSFYQVAARSFSQPRLHSGDVRFSYTLFPFAGGRNTAPHWRCGLVSILICRGRGSSTPTGHGCSKLHIWICKHAADSRQQNTTTLQCRGRDIWMLNSPEELPAGQPKRTLVREGTCSCPSPPPPSITSFSWCLWLSPPPTSSRPGQARNPPCFNTFRPCLPFLFAKAEDSSGPSLLLPRCEIIAFLLAMTEAISPPEIHSKCKCKNHLSGLLPRAHSPLFHPPSPPPGSPFFYYIKHKLLAFVLRVVLRRWQLIQMPYTST